MSTTVSYIVREVPAISGDEDAMQQLREGLGNAVAFVIPAELEDVIQGKAGWAWDRLLDDVIAEMAPNVAKQLELAIQRRLPWTYDE
jgi:hypothetical protein